MKVIIKIGGMSCSACSSHIEKTLNKHDGIDALVNLVMGNAVINYDEEKVSLQDIENYVKESGYEYMGIYHEDDEKKDNSKKYLIIYSILILLLMYVGMSHMSFLPKFKYFNPTEYPVIYGITLCLLSSLFLIYGIDILKSGIKKLLHKSANMDTLVTVSVLASFIYSLVNLILVINGNFKMVHQLYFESSAMIIYFIKLGRLIEHKGRNKTMEAVKKLVLVTPGKALLKHGNKEKEVTIDEVKKGDILICKPGMKIAVDGIIVDGVTHLDEAFITGESMPSKKQVNDKVIAGSMNIDGYILYKADKIGKDSTISMVVHLVMDAINSKMPIERLADKVSSYFVPTIFVIAMFSFIGYLLLGYSFNEALISFVTILVVACPCALGLATPLSIVTSIGNCSEKGILVKESELLEVISKVDTVIFDKTGTLTYGNLKVNKIYNYSDYSDNELLKMVASLERKSSHPIASAFKDIDGSRSVIDFQNIDGIGISGIINKKHIFLGNAKLLNKLMIKNEYIKHEQELIENNNSIIYVIIDNKISALIGVSDILRDDVKDVVKRLQEDKKRVIILSGDNEKVTEYVANILKVDEYHANLLPKDKEEIIKRLKSDGHKVMMMGDGINDAPSLSLSDVSVSIKGSSDIAMDSAMVILTTKDLSKILSLFEISYKTMKIMRENLFWAFIYNILMIPIAIGLFKGINLSISPLLASIAMTLSSLIVLCNSLRLRR